MCRCLRLRELGQRTPRFLVPRFPYSSIAARREFKTKNLEATLISSLNDLAGATKDLEEVLDSVEGRVALPTLWNRSCELVEDQAPASREELLSLSFRATSLAMTAASMRSGFPHPALAQHITSTSLTSRNLFMGSWPILREVYLRLKPKLKEHTRLAVLWSRSLTSEMARNAMLLSGWTL